MADQAERLRAIVKENMTNVNPARVITITSGKGGVGKTSFAVNLGITLSKMGQKVLLVDADLGLANVDVMLGMIPKFNLGHVLLGEKKIADILINGPEGIKIIPGGSGLYKLANLGEKKLTQCLEHLNELEKTTDIILIDTGAGLSKSVLKFVLAAGEVIIITTPEPTAITDAYGIIKVIAGTKRELPIRVVVNMVKNEKEAGEVMERLSAVTQRFLGMDLVRLGFIPSDTVVPKAVKQQQPFVLSHPRSAVAQSVMEMANQLISGDVPITTGPLSFFERLLGVFKQVDQTNENIPK
ncbi:MAG: MinD/ParA family protein [Firmicutes bacterium]|nr:MinD/ParA family protein [Bacillota bacterium]